MRAIAPLAMLLVSFGALSQKPVDPAPPPRAEVTGDLPAVLKVKLKSAAFNDVSLATSVRRPTYVAPSAMAYGRSEFSTLPADLSFYAGLTEKSNTRPRALLDTLEARFEKGPAATMAFDVTRREVLVGQDLARKLGLKGNKDSELTLPPFRLGGLTFSGVTGRVVPTADLPSDSLDGVLPLSLFDGMGVHWEPAAERITLYAAGTSPEASQIPGAFPVPSRCVGGVLLLGVVLQDKVEGYLLLNPAQPHSALDADAARRAEVQLKPIGDVGRNQLLRGSLAEEARIRLGRAQVSIKSARVLDLASSLPEDSLGIMGRETFGIFSYYIEPGACTVIVIPPRKSEP